MAEGDVSADVLIVGSGPIGATYARILVEAGRSVLMLDAGAQLTAVAGAHMRNHHVYQHNKNNFEDVVSGNLQLYSVPSQSGYEDTLDRVAFWARSDKAFNYHNPKQDPT